jgi:hypothetical protein
MSFALHRFNTLAAFSMLISAAAMPCQAASSAASSASDSVAASVGSVSGSLKTSSGSSTKGDGVAAGDYKIIDVAAAPEQPGMVRLRLQAQAQAEASVVPEDFFLYLPQHALDQSRLALGQQVTARPRAYGVEFSNSQTKQAFYLVLADEWFRELDSKPVLL